MFHQMLSLYRRRKKMTRNKLEWQHDTRVRRKIVNRESKEKILYRHPISTLSLANQTIHCVHCDAEPVLGG